MITDDDQLGPLVDLYIGRAAGRLAMTAVLAGALATSVAGTALAEDAFTVTPLAELMLSELPSDPLYWRVQEFAAIEEAEAAARAAPPSLTATFDARAFLFTLRFGSDADAKEVTNIGPVPRVEASQYLVRINSAVAPVGTKTKVHTHPGPESFLRDADRIRSA